MKRLGINIDHVATIRNARGETYPDPLRAALVAQYIKAGVSTFPWGVVKIPVLARDDDVNLFIFQLKLFMLNFLVLEIESKYR